MRQSTYIFGLSPDWPLTKGATHSHRIARALAAIQTFIPVFGNFLMKAAQLAADGERESSGARGAVN
jgi:hypothetical protein